MFRLHGVARILPLVAALGGCIDSSGPQIEVSMTQSEFTKPAAGPAIVRFNVYNAGDTYAYFSGCESPIPVVLDRDNNGTWEEAADYNTSCAGAGQDLSLPPGSTHLDSIAVADANTYRISVWFGSSIQSPYAYATRSGTFDVR